MARARMSGKILMDAVVQLAHQKGWIAAHFTSVTDSRGFHRTTTAYDARGWPDLALARERVIFIEIKGDGDRLRDDQVRWIEALEEAMAEVHVVKPKDWLDGTVEEILA